MIYLRRLPRALGLLGLVLCLGGLGLLVLSVNVVYAAMTQPTWREALDRADPQRRLR